MTALLDVAGLKEEPKDIATRIASENALTVLAAAVPEAQIRAIVDYEIAGPTFMVGMTTEQFRAVKTAVEEREGNKVRLPADAARALQLHVGDPVRIVELCPAPTS